jgi:hypothetical protein
MNLGDVERELRAGPPEESSYRVRPLLLESGPTAAQRLPATRPLPRPLGAMRLAVTIVGAAVLITAGFVAGRFTDAQPTAPGAAAPTGIRVQPAFLSDVLRRTFYSGADRQHEWMVCAVASDLTCADASVHSTADPLNTDEWAFLKAVTVPSGDVIVGAQLDPVLPVVAFLSPADNPSAAGPQLVPVSILPGDTFLDLGRLVPGRYVLSVLSSPTSPVMSGQLAIGIVVR